jgi:hypothetical protein
VRMSEMAATNVNSSTQTRKTIWDVVNVGIVGYLRSEYSGIELL